MTAFPRIAIVGGGPAGLTLAAILQRHGHSFTVFEGDASATARDQGGTLDLHPGEGQAALERAGLLERFMAVARHEDQEQRVIDHASGAVLHEEIPEPGTGDRPEIDRVVLRQLLLDAIGGAHIRWGMRVSGVRDHPDGGHALVLENGNAGPFDLVVGADGAWSPVRAALTATRPVYTGVTFVELWLSDVNSRHPDLAAMVGHGTMFALHDGRGIIAQRNGNAAIRVYAAFRTTPEEGDRPDRSLAGITTDDLLARFEGWAASLRALVTQAARIAAIRPIVALPPDLRWPARAGLTLVGDAAHVMPPLGTGVNLAMLDAAELAELLIGADDWPEAVATYQTRMLTRAERLADECRSGFAEMFSSEGTSAVLDQFGGTARDS